MTGTVRITITYPTPGTQPDIDAVKSVLIAADPYWAADYSSESTPGKVAHHRRRRMAGRRGRYCRRPSDRGPGLVGQHRK